MRVLKRYLLAALLIITAVLAGCSSMPTAPWNKHKEAELGVVPYHPDSLWNLKLGRDYASAGRYELAKEHYLLAMAAANNDEMRDMLAGELKSVDMMIKTMR